MTAIPSTVEIIDIEEVAPKAVLVTSRVLTKKIPKPTEAFQILSRSFKFLSYFGLLVGADIGFEWKRNARFFFAEFFTLFFWSQFFYTQVLYVNEHDSVRIFEVFAMYGIGVSSALKLASYEIYFKNIAALFQSTLKICQQSTGSRGDRVKRRLLENFTLYKFLAFLGVPITITYMFYPVQSFLMRGELVQLLPIEIMFVDQSTKFGYFIASSIMAVGGLLAIFGTVYMGMAFDYLIANYSPRVDILEIDFHELDEMWEDTSTTTLAHRRMFLRNICRKYIDMRDYITEVKKIFDKKLFVFFTFAYLSQILCMYHIRANNWIPGYALAVGFFMEMITYCAMGTKLEVDNERVMYIMTQSKWYTYDLKSQKLMLLLMNLATNSDELWIGQLMPLNVFTATEIVKSIYSYYTVMMEVM